MSAPLTGKLIVHFLFYFISLPDHVAVDPAPATLDWLHDQDDDDIHHSQEDYFEFFTIAAERRAMNKNQGLADRIGGRLETLGLSPNAASDKAGLDRTLVGRYVKGRVRNPRRDSLQKLAEALHCSVEWLATGNGAMEAASPPPSPPGNVQRREQNSADDPPTLPPGHEMPLDIPVFGTAAGSLGEGAFAMEQSVVDYVRRPPGVARAKDIYAIYIEGDSMEPRYQHGELVYVSPRRPARPGDYVIVQVQNGEHEEVQAYCKRLLRRTADQLILLQHNPETELNFAMNRVRAVHRILSMADLMGV